MPCVESDLPGHAILLTSAIQAVVQPKKPVESLRDDQVQNVQTLKADGNEVNSDNEEAEAKDDEENELDEVAAGFGYYDPEDQCQRCWDCKWEIVCGECCHWCVRASRISKESRLSQYSGRMYLPAKAEDTEMFERDACPRCGCELLHGGIELAGKVVDGFGCCNNDWSVTIVRNA